MNDCVTFPDTGLDFDGPPYRGSFQQLLSNNIGRSVKIDYMIGSGNLISQTGTILNVGTQYVLLKNKNVILTGDIFSIKFITFLCDC